VRGIFSFWWFWLSLRPSGVTRGHGGRGPTAPGDTFQGDTLQGVTREWKKKMCGWIYKEQWTNEVTHMRRLRKGPGWYPPLQGVTPEWNEKSDSSLKSSSLGRGWWLKISSVISGKKWGDTAELTADGDDWRGLFFREKIEWHRQLPPGVTPTLVMPPLNPISSHWISKYATATHAHCAFSLPYLC